MEQIKHVTFSLPGFIYLVGQSNQGKTYFVFNGIIPEALTKGYDIHWVVNKAFDVEKPLAKQALEYPNVFIHRAKNLDGETMRNLINIIRSNENKKLVIIDNFTYGITPEFLDYTTFARKFNASTIFISHTLFANNKISPRLRELVSYFIFFYLPMSNSYRRILDDEMFETYQEQIESKSYKFLIVDLNNSHYSIGKLPEYTINIITKDQRQRGKLGEALRELSLADYDTKGTRPKGTRPKGHKNKTI